ncbi:MAG: ribosome small subunit-dependent GTPase A [Proteobacteria bacterium]|nr:ribosome small subunit-dependent GTPase A [Pseudomonadota bacterium]
MTERNEQQSNTNPQREPLQRLGWNATFAQHLAAMKEVKGRVARVLSVRRKSFLVGDGENEWSCTVAGRFKQKGEKVFPVTGDWVLIDDTVINEVLPRKNTLSRGAAGTHGRQTGRPAREQAIAANIDTVFIVCGLDRDFNINRIERTLTLVFNCDLLPVIVLTKADLHESPESFSSEVKNIAFDVPVVLSSMHDDRGLNELESYLGSGQTIAMFGSSGVGKSTLANRLYGSDIQATQAVSISEDKGRHTTTKRELIHMPQGGMLMDSPGIREVSFFEAGTGVENAFPDIVALAELCRFSDCKHTHEPGCAVISALASGKLKRDRFESYHTMKSEMESLSKR